ncbi:hypothetical protein ACLKA7_013426 [Drosophila subpalustris]
MDRDSLPRVPDTHGDVVDEKLFSDLYIRTSWVDAQVALDQIDKTHRQKQLHYCVLLCCAATMLLAGRKKSTTAAKSNNKNNNQLHKRAKTTLTTTSAKNSEALTAAIAGALSM